MVKDNSFTPAPEARTSNIALLLFVLKVLTKKKIKAKRLERKT